MTTLAALRESLAICPDAVLVYDESRTLRLINPAAAALFRRPERELVGSELVALEGEAEPDLRVPFVSPESPSWRGPVQLEVGASAPIRADVVARGLRLAGEALCVAAVRDMAPLKLLSGQQAHSSELLRQAVRLAALGIFDHDHETGALYWSPELRRMFDVTMDEPARFERAAQMTHPDDIQAVVDRVSAAHDPAGSGRLEGDHRIIWSDGSIHWHALTSQTLFDGEGTERRPARTLGVVVDMTERMRATQERERLVAVLDGTPDIVGIRDAEGRLLYLNPAARRLMDVREETELASLVLGFAHTEDSRRLLEEVALPQARRTGVWRGETTLLGKAGTEVPLSQVVLAHRDAQGRLTSYSTIARDISEAKRLEAELVQAQKLEAVGRLAGGLAHDMNNILSVILCTADVIGKDFAPGSSVAAELTQITDAAERAADLTRQLLTYSRRQLIRPIVLDVNSVLESTSVMMRRLIGEDILLELHTSNGPANIRVDRTQLEQVILNLAINARDAMPEGGRLTFVARVEVEVSEAIRKELELSHQAHVVVAIADTGHGMDPPTRERIFEPFFSTKEVGKGTGLGLATVVGVMQQSGGNVRVDSTPGRGTTFELYFPRAEGDLESLSAPERPSPRQPGSGNILVVEDENSLRHVLVQMLRSEGYRAHGAATPEEALGLLSELDGDIDLLLTDVVMPQLNGRQLADKVRERCPQSEVLYMSGHAENAISHEGVMEAGIRFLAKPVTLQSLLSAVEQALAGG